jgi:alpha-aminoadipic semialdehyde synthase
MGPKGPSRRAVYTAVFRREDRRDLARHLPYLTILTNGIYWEPSQPRLVRKGDLKALSSGATPPKLRLVADISCDIGGSVAATVRTTTPDDPVHVLDPQTGEATSGVAGHGTVVLAVDNLPAELPRNASEHFGDALMPFVAPLLGANLDDEFEFLALPSAIAGAVVVHRVELTPRYRYLAENL